MISKKLAAALMIVGVSTSPAAAASYAFKLNGSGISALVHLTYAANPNTGVLPLTSPNPVDPIGSFIVTGVRGTFTDTTIGITGAAIGAIVPSQPAHPEPANLYAPHSFGFYPIVNGVPGPGGTAPGLSYDDLFYPGGSPRTASDYPFHGGVLDIYGLVFKLADGNAVNVWSNGDMGDGVSFSAAVTDGINVLDYTGPVSAAAVPEPAAWALLIGGFGLIGATWRRSRAAVRRAEASAAT